MNKIVQKLPTRTESSTFLLDILCLDAFILSLYSDEEIYLLIYEPPNKLLMYTQKISEPVACQNDTSKCFASHQVFSLKWALLHSKKFELNAKAVIDFIKV